MTTDERERVTAREINDTIRYTCWTVYRRTGVPAPDGAQADLESVIAELDATDVVIRGFYDVSALRGDADLMVWMHAPAAELVQQGLRRLRRSAVGPSMEQTWSAMGLHRPAEFNKGHVPAFMAGKGALEWATVYPFVRSYEWYLLPDDERRAMLVEHGTMGRGYGGILSNTVAAFALGDYEWILALESDELHEIVDMMRHLRSSQARRHVREETPFYTGRRIDAASVVELLA
ncbi:MAG: chlorite dismutase family protein [Actinomycetota bacterium]|nr:chlorite dismutase family protein [Actinomycetota bacterium]